MAKKKKTQKEILEAWSDPETGVFEEGPWKGIINPETKKIITKAEVRALANKTIHGDTMPADEIAAIKLAREWYMKTTYKQRMIESQEARGLTPKGGSKAQGKVTGGKLTPFERWALERAKAGEGAITAANSLERGIFPSAINVHGSLTEKELKFTKRGRPKPERVMTKGTVGTPTPSEREEDTLRRLGLLPKKEKKPKVVKPITPSGAVAAHTPSKSLPMTWGGVTAMSSSIEKGKRQLSDKNTPSGAIAAHKTKRRKNTKGRS